MTEWNLWTDPVGLSDPSIINAYLRRLIRAEADRQLLKWGSQSHTPAEWGLIVTEEFGEAMKELCNLHFSTSRLTFLEARARFVTEAIETVTLLLKMILMAEAREDL